MGEGSLLPASTEGEGEGEEGERGTEVGEREQQRVLRVETLRFIIVITVDPFVRLGFEGNTSCQISRIRPFPDPNRAEMDAGGADLRSSIKKWKIIYPVYLNSKKTVAEGRRIAAAKACPDPTCIEIADSCAYLKIPRAIELDKAYPRDFFQVGRVRVQLTNDDGSPVNPAITTKDSGGNYNVA
ncbi:Signal recognition particle 19 kDa protein [Triticum urartu]|uniref:Signal recognition particle 19 kDa protein n=1 Tax=Triticum urartu TaxID=4572 RepID=M7YXX8_TRIUA|nr:Signal recognition particle 19 kDa protein [Triticum urartu]